MSLIRTLLLLAVAVWFGPTSAIAQGLPTGSAPTRRVSLTEGLALLGQANIELQLARLSVASAQARALGAAVFPNPGIHANREQLSGDGGGYAETVVALAQVLEIGGQRGLRTEAAERAVVGADLRLASERARLAFELHHLYVRAAQAEADLAALTEAAGEFRKVEEAGRVRFAEGDISRYDRSRLQIERARYETLLAQSGLRLSEAGRELALLIAPGSLASDSLVLPADALAAIPGRSITVGLEEALATAAEHVDVRAAEAEVEVARANLALQQRERIPDLTVTGGYKHQTDGRQGAVLGVSLPFPIWNRNRGEIALANAELETALARRDLVRLRVENDIRRTWQTHRSHEERLQLLSQGLLPESAELLATARVAYELEEMSLLELLDAAEAYRVSREALHQLLADALIAEYDLERALGRLPEPASGLGADASLAPEER